MYELTIGIVTWNSERYIEKCLDCLSKQSFKDFDLIIVDNGSTDRTIDIVIATSPNARIIRNDKNLGFCGGHNLAIKYSKSKYYMPYNPDIFATEEFLSQMIITIRKDETLGSISGKLLRFDPINMMETNIIDSTGIYFKKNRRSLDRGAEEFDSGQYDHKQYVFGASGAAPLYNRDMLEDIKIEGQYFFEDFFAYREDVDVAWRAQLRGWKCLYNPQAKAYHVRTNTPEKRKEMSDFVNMHSVKNRIIMLIQNESFLGVIKDGWFFIPYDLMIVFFVLLKERTSIGALKYVLRNMRYILNRRKVIQNRSTSDYAEMLSWFGKVRFMSYENQ